MVTNIFWNRQEQRLRTLLRLIIFIALFIGGFFLLTVWHLKERLVLLGGPGIMIADVLPYVLLFLWSLLALWLAARFLDHRPFADYGFHWGKQWWGDFVVGLLLGAGLTTFVFLLERALGWATITHTFYSIYPGVPFSVAFLSQLIFAVAVGFWESMIFVGYPIRNISEGLKRPLGLRGTSLVALLLPAIVFGFAHIMNPHATLVSTIGVAFAGVLFGLAYVLTGNLALSIGFHLIGDLFEGSVFGFPVSGSPIHASFITFAQGGPDTWTGGSFGPEAGLLAFVFIIIAIVLVLVWIRWTYGKLSWRTPLAQYTPRLDKKKQVAHDVSTLV